MFASSKSVSTVDFSVFRGAFRNFEITCEDISSTPWMTYSTSLPIFPEKPTK